MLNQNQINLLLNSNMDYTKFSIEHLLNFRKDLISIFSKATADFIIFDLKKD